MRRRRIAQLENTAVRAEHRGWSHVLCGITLLLATASASAQTLDQLSLDRWKKLREVERYQ
ncbi:MAG: hypothetical protein ABGZ17_20520, partial [Planctomycetaceae bacterium]